MGKARGRKESTSSSSSSSASPSPERRVQQKPASPEPIKVVEPPPQITRKSPTPPPPSPKVVLRSPTPPPEKDDSPEPPAIPQEAKVADDEPLQSPANKGPDDTAKDTTPVEEISPLLDTSQDSSAAVKHRRSLSSSPELRSKKSKRRIRSRSRSSSRSSSSRSRSRSRSRRSRSVSLPRAYAKDDLAQEA